MGSHGGRWKESVPVLIVYLRRTLPVLHRSKILDPTPGRIRGRSGGYVFSGQCRDLSEPVTLYRSVTLSWEYSLWEKE